LNGWIGAEPGNLDVQKAAKVTVVRQRRVDTVFTVQNSDDGVGDQSAVHPTFAEDCPERLPMSQARTGNMNGRAAQRVVAELNRLANQGYRPVSLSSVKSIT
jgi:hypothetical protein